MNGLLTDLYELTMAAGYFQAGKAEEVVPGVEARAGEAEAIPLDDDSVDACLA